MSRIRYEIFGKEGEILFYDALINEAVEICKKFAGDNDYQFVNGILGAISKDKAEK